MTRRQVMKTGVKNPNTWHELLTLYNAGSSRIVLPHGECLHFVVCCCKYFLDSNGSNCKNLQFEHLYGISICQFSLAFIVFCY
jgi:hypothetical protein